MQAPGVVMRILVTNIPAVVPCGPAADYVRETLVPLTRANAMQVAAPGTELVFRFCARGEAHPAFADFRHLPRLNPQAMRVAVRQAEAEGFDAAILGCFGDPFLVQCRGDVSIPVAAFGESSMLLAASMGRRFGIVAPSSFLVEPIRRQVASYGLTDRLADVCASAEPAAEQEHGLLDARDTIGYFRAAARRLIAAGADVIIPGCGLLSPALRLAPGAVHDYPRGCTEVDGIPVVDIVAASVLAAESLLRLRRAGAAYHGSWSGGEQSRVPDADTGGSVSAPTFEFWDL